MNNTAISRNFIIIPKLLSQCLALSLYLEYCYLVKFKQHVFIGFITTVLLCLIGFKLMGILSNYLTRQRFKSWASEMRGVHEDDFYDFLDQLDPEELEKMVAMDLEGWNDDEE